MEFQLWGFFYFTLNCFYLLTTADRTVFRSDSQAKTIFLRPKRANSFLLEEILKGNLERECYEEKCTKEEAREVFEDNQKTEAFWNKYHDGDQCESNPCQHGGTCKDKIGGYSCHCTDMYTGDNCEKDVSECPTGGLLVCEQFCRSLHDSYRCFCARGYTLHSDGRSCIPQDKDSCGRVVSDVYMSKSKDRNDSICPQGKCPWQVTFMSVGGEEICHGVILGRKSILTSAACLAKDVDSLIIVHSNEKINSSQVTERIAHDRYIPGKPADDLAFFVLKEPIALGSGPIQLCLPEKDFSENILMKHGKEGMTVGATNKPSYLPLDICQSKLNLSFSLTNKMFCMEEQEPEGMSKRSEEKKIECDLASGSPVATMEGNTAFLTGLFMSQSDCTQGLVFTKISRYLPWIRNLLKKKETVQR